MSYWGDIELPDEDELGERNDLPNVCASKANLSQTSKPVLDDEE